MFPQPGTTVSGYAAQYLITDEVAKAVVDGLEVIDIQDDQREWVPVALKPGQLATENIHEFAPVIGTGQFIELRLLLQFQAQLVALGNVAGYPDYRPFAVDQR